MRPRRLIILTMTMSGGLAGMAGAGELLGVTHQTQTSFATSVGFDSIAVALLARSNPLAIIPAAILFGAMRAGAGQMQIEARTPRELVDVLQAVILLVLVVLPVIARALGGRGAQGDPGRGPDDHEVVRQRVGALLMDQFLYGDPDPRAPLPDRRLPDRDPADRAPRSSSGRRRRSASAPCAASSANDPASSTSASRARC